MKKHPNEIPISKKKTRGDMAKLVDATDLIGLSLGMETYQVKTFKFRETLEFTMGNPEPNPVFRKQTNKSSERENQKRIGAETQWKLF